MQAQNNNDNKIFAQDEFKQEVKEAAQQHTVNVTVKKDEQELFANDEFKSELKEAAGAHMDTAGYLWEEHKGVARDAAAMAASKSSDFAKAIEGESAADMDKEMLLLKDKAVETLTSAKATLGVAKEALVIAYDEAKDATLEAYDATRESLAQAYDMSKEKTALAYEWTADKLEGVIEEVKERTSETLEFIGDKMKVAGDKMIDRAEKIAPVSSIGMPMPSGPLSSSQFADELKDAAVEHNQSAGCQWEAHKDVARDAAAMAASKSSEFAKAADGEGLAAGSEGYIDMAKEKLGETVGLAKEKGMLAYGWTGEKIEVVLEGAKEKTGEALEYIGDKMKGAGGAMMEKGLEAQDKGIELQDKAAAPTSV